MHTYITFTLMHTRTHTHTHTQTEGGGGRGYRELEYQPCTISHIMHSAVHYISFYRKQMHGLAYHTANIEVPAVMTTFTTSLRASPQCKVITSSLAS